MSFLFGKKQSAQSLADVLEDGRELMNAEMKKPKFNKYAGRVVFMGIAVRVQPENEPSFEAKMKTSLLKAHFLKSGVRVKYDSAEKEQLTMDDEPAEILERNPQLKK